VRTLPFARIRLEGADKRLEDARQAWSKHLSRLEEAWLESALLAKHGVQKIALLLPRAPKLTGSTTEVAEAIERLDRLREGLLEETEAQASLTAAIEACREKEEALQSRRGATQAEVDGAVAARAKSERTLSEAEAEVEANAAKMKEAVETLDAAFCRWPGWPERLEKTPRGFFEDAEARVETFEAKSMARTELGPRQAEADQAASLAAQTARQADEALEEAKRAHADRSARAAELAKPHLER